MTIKSKREGISAKKLFTTGTIKTSSIKKCRARKLKEKKNSYFKSLYTKKNGKLRLVFDRFLGISSNLEVRNNFYAHF
jgi:hypothetical protein